MSALLLHTFLIAAAVSLLFALLGKFGLSMAPDRNVGRFKAHRGHVPRLGGIAIAAAVFSVVFLNPIGWELTPLLLLICGGVLLTGLLEDFTHATGPALRFCLTLALATAAFVFADVRLTHMDVPLFDHGMASPVVSFIVTIFAISGVTHAVNISDGAHGLAAGISAMSMMSMAAIAFLSGDTELGILLAVIGAATLGFLIVNFPCGWLFLGDGGAYLLGFSSACTAVLLVERNPDVSPWAPLVLLAYPVWETLFSVGRRMTLERARATDPDGLHLHSLIMKSLWRRFGTHENRNLLNALSAVPILVVTAVLSGVVLSNYADTRSLEAVIILFISGYVSAYLFTRRTVRDGVLALATKRRMHARPMQMQRRSTLRGFTASGTDNPVGNVRNSSPRR